MHLQERENSDDQLRIISQKQSAELANYLFDPLLGAGSTIYVLDSGFNLQHQEFAPGGHDRRVDSVYVSNAFTLLPQEPNRNIWAPEGMEDYSGHGTAVASVAAGITHGVASGADLVMVKFKQFTRNPNTGGTIPWHSRQAMSAALDYAMGQIQIDVAAQRDRGNTGKFIVNMSYGKWCNYGRYGRY